MRATAAADFAGKDLTDADRAVLYKSLSSIAANLESYYKGLLKNGR